MISARRSGHSGRSRWPMGVRPARWQVRSQAASLRCLSRPESSASSASMVWMRVSGHPCWASQRRRLATSSRASSMLRPQWAILVSARSTLPAKRSAASRREAFSRRPWRRSWEKGPSLGELLFGGVQPVVGPVRWPHPEGAFEFASFGEEALGVSWRVVDGEAGVGETAEGVKDFLLGAALVGKDAAVVDLWQSGDVPGVGGMPGTALPGVPGEAFQGGRAEQMNLAPSSALDAIDGAGPTRGSSSGCHRSGGL